MNVRTTFLKCNHTGLVGYGYRLKNRGSIERSLFWSTMCSTKNNSQRVPISVLLAATTPRDESHMDMKQTLEKARETLGPNWLQYLVHSKASSASSAAPGQRRLDLARDAIPPPDATDDDIFLNAEENPVVVLEDQVRSRTFVSSSNSRKHQERLTVIAARNLLKLLAQEFLWLSVIP